MSFCGVEIGLWAPDGSALRVPGVGTKLQRLRGDPAEALRAFGGASIIHDNGIWLPHNHMLSQLADTTGVSRIVSTRGMLEPWAFRHKYWKKRIAWHLYQRGDLARATCHHATSEQEAENLRRFALGVPVEIIPNGIDVPNESQLGRWKVKRDDKIALFLGRLYPVKGLPDLLHAWARVRPSGWTLQIAGPDEAGHRAKLERMIRDNGLTPCVRLLGEIAPEDRSSLYSQADLFILPSHSESFGMVVAEALAHGVPVLTTSAVPWPILEEKGFGWRVEPKPDSLANGLRTATSLEAKALREMGKKGRAFVQDELSWQAVARRTISMYENTIERQQLSKGGC